MLEIHQVVVLVADGLGAELAALARLGTRARRRLLDATHDVERVRRRRHRVRVASWSKARS